jgi:predicted hotdog family 3-hydroxylacyl-ACP dehydratase
LGENDVEEPDIRSLVPQKGPMMLLDRVISAGEEELCAEVRIRPGSLFCGEDGVGAWIGIEYMAQAIGAYAGYTARLRGEPVRIGLLLGTRRYVSSCHKFPTGSTLRVHVQRVLQNENGLASFECRIENEQGSLVTASLTVYQLAEGTDFPEGNPA